MAVNDKLLYEGDSRTYCHVGCGGLSLAEGKPFEIICDPLMPLVQTHCDSCGQEVKLRDLEWVDTGESLDDYRTRLRAQLPKYLQSWVYGLGFMVGGLVGAGLGFVAEQYTGRGRAGFPLLPTIGFFIIGFFTHIVGAPILKWLFGLKIERLK